MRRALWHQHPHVANDLTFGERAADVLKARFGSWGFLAVLNVIFVVEVAVHIATRGRWDQGLLLLNLFLSWLAAQQGGALQIAANRGDRINSEVALHTQANSDALMEMNRQQLAILTQLQHINAELDMAREQREQHEGNA